MIYYQPIDEDSLKAEKKIRDAIGVYNDTGDIYGVIKGLICLPQGQMLDSLDSLLDGFDLKEIKKQSLRFSARFSADLMKRISSLNEGVLTVVGGDLYFELLLGFLLNCAHKHKISLAVALQHLKSIVSKNSNFGVAFPDLGECFFDKFFNISVYKPVLLVADIYILYNLIIFNLNEIYTSKCSAGVARVGILHDLILELQYPLSIITKIKHQARNKKAKSMSVRKIGKILLLYLDRNYTEFEISSFEIIKLAINLAINLAIKLDIKQAIKQVGFNLRLSNSWPDEFQKKLSQGITWKNFICAVTDKSLVQSFSQQDDGDILIRVRSLLEIYFAFARKETEQRRKYHFELLGGECKRLKHKLGQIKKLKFIVAFYSLVGFATKYDDHELDSALGLSTMINFVTAKEFAATSNLENKSYTSQRFSLCHLKPGGGCNENDSVRFMICGIDPLDFNTRNFDLVMEKIYTLWVEDKPDRIVQDFYTALLSLCISRVVSLSGKESVFDYIYTKFNEIHLQEFAHSFFACKTTESRARFLQEASSSFALFCKKRLLLSSVEEDSFKKSFKEKLEEEFRNAENWSRNIIGCSGNYVLKGLEWLFFYGSGNSAGCSAEADPAASGLLEAVGEEPSFVRK